MRKYQPAWERLKELAKQNKPLRIAAVNKLHPRIFHAVRKEKGLDVVFHLEMAENCKKSRIIQKSKANELLIWLITSIGIDDL